MDEAIARGFSLWFRAPSPAWSATAVLVRAAERVMLVGRGGYRGNTIQIFELTREGFDQGRTAVLEATYYATFAFHDGETFWVGVRAHDGSLELEDEHGRSRVLRGELPDARVHAVFDDARRVPVFCVQGKIYDVLEDALVERLDTGGYCETALFVEGTLYLLRPDDLLAVVDRDVTSFSLPYEVKSTLAWDERVRALAVLVEDEVLAPAWFEQGAWRVGEPIADALDGEALLAFHPSLSALVVFGGTDPDHFMRSERNEVFVVHGPRLTASFSRRDGRSDVVGRVGREHLVVNASDLTVERLTPAGFLPHTLCAQGAGPRERLDDRYIRIAVGGDSVWVMREDGTMFRSSSGGYEAVPADVPDAVARRRGGELLWDEASERLLLLGGHERNDVHAFEHGAWREVAHTPFSSETILVPTPRGIYAVERTGALWCTLDAGWGKGTAAPLPRRTYVHRAVYEPRRDALLLLTVRGGAIGTFALYVVRDATTDLVCALDATARDLLFGQTCFLVDEPSDRLLCLHESSISALDLSLLGATRIGLPRVEPFEVHPRPAITRPAAQLVASDRAHPIEAVPISDDYVFLAWVPASELLPLGGHASIAVGMVDDLFAHDTSDPFSPGFAVVLLDSAPPGPVVLGADDAVLADSVAFDDPDPTKLEEMDTTSDWDRATKTKVGGYPRPVQGGREEAEASQTSSPCRKCGTPMRFVLQLAQDLFDIGDSGRALVYVCPSGCDAGATADCH